MEIKEEFVNVPEENVGEINEVVVPSLPWESESNDPQNPWESESNDPQNPWEMGGEMEIEAEIERTIQVAEIANGIRERLFLPFLEFTLKICTHDNESILEEVIKMDALLEDVLCLPPRF